MDNKGKKHRKKQNNGKNHQRHSSLHSNGHSKSNAPRYSNDRSTSDAQHHRLKPDLDLDSVSEQNGTTATLNHDGHQIITSNEDALNNEELQDTDNYKRRITSNWAKYEQTDMKISKDTYDFNSLLEISGGNNYFRLKDELDWEIKVEDHCVTSEFLLLDCEDLGKAILGISLPSRLMLQYEHFPPKLLKKFESLAKENHAMYTNNTRHSQNLKDGFESEEIKAECESDSELFTVDNVDISNKSSVKNSSDSNYEDKKVVSTSSVNSICVEVISHEIKQPDDELELLLTLSDQTLNASKSNTGSFYKSILNTPISTCENEKPILFPENNLDDNLENWLENILDD